MSELLDAVRAGASPDELLDCEVPTRYRAAYTRLDEIGIFEGATDKDVRRSIHVGEVEMPELAPDEALVAVMSAAVNFNSVWTAVFEPIPTFYFLNKLGKRDPRHDQPYHVFGSDASGVVVRTGSQVRHFKVGDKVVISPAVVDEQDPLIQEDGVLTNEPIAWGFENNYGAFGQFCIVKAHQLMPKPAHLSWEEAAANTLCAATSYRMLIGRHGARMKLGDVVLVWGATGGLGSYAVQLVLQAGGIPVAVVSSEEKAELVRRQGCEHVINRSEIDFGDRGLSHPKGWRRLGEEIRRLVGEDPHIVFEYLGRETFGASTYVARRGGRIVTCGSSTGYRHEYDNRYLWMNIKSIVGSHGFNYQEAMETNRLFRLGRLYPTLSKVYPLEETAEAVRAVQTNSHVGKVGILIGATAEHQGIDDPAARERFGEDKITLYRQQ
ncbi:MULTISPECIES: crotonyl-CoA carboxylase/reductase [Thermomonospora]|uniref:Crotonyl-CoA reductase n=1 Tax=Thermomonospora curvata (strain ATCC 19995 / DSM 43183 / JCM 3096 / KCTC 9072 / NBRC 15933 / NCIMB 10081 / Henssen B9) TaxID=471852 RepID=D1A770_THECD|nr:MULTISPECIES: crotonyl-CoA carboxylase/reductase [Thermomonospora]ACZ00276.1 crotonyl-CoA reductase [Thermomonospora curvata DSM 43183]PKK12074.1 MAG: crotonyl-CoA carboxylase/reductase [Thermomonospora sp. CIF 1]